VRRLDPIALAIVAFAVLIYLPALRIGLTLDDAWWALAVRHPGNADGIGPFDIAFSPDEAAGFWSQHGLGFWWGTPEFRWKLFRPVAAALFEAELAWFGPRAGLWQAVNLGVYVALLGVAWPLLRGIADRTTALVALFLFATHASHAQAVWWVSNAHSALAAVPALAALQGWIAWRRDGWLPGLPIAMVGFALGLATSETALAGVCFALGWELWRPRVQPAFVGAVGGVAVAYVVGHGLLGYGLHGSGVYADPRDNPAAYAHALATRLPVLVGGSLEAYPTDLYERMPQLQPAFWVAGLLTLGIQAWLTRLAWADLPEATRDGLRWTVTGALGTLLLVAPAAVGGRLLLWPSLAASLVLAVGMVGAFRKRPSRAAVGWAGATAVITLLLWPLSTPLVLTGVGNAVGRLREEARTADVPAGADVVVVTLPDALTAHYLLPTRLLDEPAAAPRSWSVLSVALADHRVVRTGDRRLEIEVLDGHWWAQADEHLFLPRSTAQEPGATWRTAQLTATLLESDDVGPTRVAFDFDRPLEELHVVAWQDGALRPLALPAVGQEVTIRWSPSALRSARDRM
jgi:hypothetical protein